MRSLPVRVFVHEDGLTQYWHLTGPWCYSVCVCPLPSFRVYVHEKGLTQYEHPLIDYYRGAVFMDKGGYRLVLKEMRAYRPTLDEVRKHDAFGLGGAGRSGDSWGSGSLISTVHPLGSDCSD